MLLIDKTLKEYIDDVDSDLSAPGGGSVASLVGALACGLARMLAHFSINKKKFKEASKSKQDKFAIAMFNLAEAKDVFEEGVDQDAISYQAVVDAYTSKDEEEIQKALNASAFISRQFQEAAILALENTNELIDLGNKNVLSDLYSACVLLESVTILAGLNLKANANLLTNIEQKNNYLNDNENNIALAKKLKNKSIKHIMKVKENI